MKIQHLLTILLHMAVGGLPGLGLFLMQNKFALILTHTQWVALVIFSYALFWIGALLGAVWGFTYLIFQKLHNKPTLP